MPAKFHVAELFVYAPVLFLMTRHFGVAGAAWAWDARTWLDAALLFAAVKLLDGLIFGWFGLLLVCTTFAWVAFASPFLHAGLLVYWLVSIVFVAIGLFWSVRAMPPDILSIAVQRLRAARRIVSVAE